MVSIDGHAATSVGREEVFCASTVTEPNSRERMTSSDPFGMCLARSEVLNRQFPTMREFAGPSEKLSDGLSDSVAAENNQALPIGELIKSLEIKYGILEAKNG